MNPQPRRSVKLYVECDAGDATARARTKSTFLQVMLLALLAIIVLTTSAFFGLRTGS